MNGTAQGQRVVGSAGGHSSEIEKNRPGPPAGLILHYDGRVGGVHGERLVSNTYLAQANNTRPIEGHALDAVERERAAPKEEHSAVHDHRAGESIYSISAVQRQNPTPLLGYPTGTGNVRADRKISQTPDIEDDICGQIKMAADAWITGVNPKRLRHLAQKRQRCCSGPDARVIKIQRTDGLVPAVQVQRTVIESDSRRVGNLIVMIQGDRTECESVQVSDDKRPGDGVAAGLAQAKAAFINEERAGIRVRAGAAKGCASPATLDDIARAFDHTAKANQTVRRSLNSQGVAGQIDISVEQQDAITAHEGFIIGQSDGQADRGQSVVQLAGHAV